jgi:hypothetical protein
MPYLIRVIAKVRKLLSADSFEKRKFQFSMPGPKVPSLTDMHEEWHRLYNHKHEVIKMRCRCMNTTDGPKTPFGAVW